MALTVTKNETKSFIDTSAKYIFQAASKHTFITKMHTHTFYELIYVLAGGCTHYIDGETHEMRTQDFLLMRPGNRHKFIDQLPDTALLCISIAKDEFQKYTLLYGDVLEKSAVRAIKLPALSPDTIYTLAKDIHTPTQNEIRAICSCLFASFADAVKKERNVPEVLSEMTAAMLATPDLLQSGIPAMLHLTNYSESQLGRLTKKHYAMSPHVYLKQLRLQAAWRYLLKTDLTPEEISLLCGYKCYGYFTNIFKEKYSLTPAVLRKNMH